VQEAFLREVDAALTDAGLCITTSAVCRQREECTRALAGFHEAGIDLLVTLHLAYSPSLESSSLLASAEWPLLLLDTTPDAAFGLDTPPERIMYNHGIHGVQDLATMLRRRKKDYFVVAGHLSEPTVLHRTAAIARAACAARALHHTRALRIGPAFVGMGDFAVRPEVLRDKLHVSVDEIAVDALLHDAEAVTEDEVAQEMARDLEAYDADVDPEVHRRSVRLGLGIRRYLERGDYRAFSMNFGAFDRGEGPLATVPFLECCKAMARGIGYAGEGDVLTAALVGALQTGFGGTSFTEMFCPDWQGNAVFLSHMGEFNPALAAAKPRLFEKPYPFSETHNPASLTCAPRPGPATLVNLAPGPDESFRLIIAPVEVLGDATDPGMRDSMRGWIRSPLPVAPFLEAYSQLGGTHHSALMLGHHTEALLAFARMTGMEGCVIG
jgi:L-arabinose isomerase